MYYLIIVVPVLILALIAQAGVKSTYNKYSKLRNARGMTGAEAARTLLAERGVYDVAIEPVEGQLSDHYDPKANVIRLSNGVYGSSSIAAVGIACHEAGHAMQYHSSYAPVKLRMSIIPVCNIASNISIPLIIVGLILSVYSIAIVGVIAFAIATLFQLVTLPVEFNASRRALEAIKDGGYLTQEEQKGAKAVLSSAAMTYVAALAVSLANLLRLLLIVSGGRRRN